MKTKNNSGWRFKKRQLTLIIITAFFLSYCLTSSGQTGNWNNNSETRTYSDVGIGTLVPDGKTEILYQTETKNGLVVTRVFNPMNNTVPVSLEEVPPSDKGITESWGNNTDNQLFHYLDLKIKQFNQNDKPLILGRTHSTLNNIYYNRLLLTSYGKLGINNDNPRGMLDIQSSMHQLNSPTAIFGIKSSIRPDYTRHIQIINNLSDKGYNDLSEEGDQGIFWTDGTGSCSKTLGNESETVEGTNKSSGFVIAPWNHRADGIKITSGGNVGIGMATPKGKLDVNGKIFCKAFDLTNPGGITIMKVTPDGFVWAQEVKVKTSDPYPDFVFLTNFKLMSLPELERFLKENKHLPSVPTEKEVSEKGMDLGKMNIVLLQKVEELTLYIIEINKKLELLEKQVKSSNN